MKRSALFFLLLISGISFSQKEYGRTICQTLSNESFYGRGYIKQGDSLAAIFIANEFKKMKVQPLGESYFQKFSFPINTFPMDIHLTINGKELAVGADYIPSDASGAFSGDWKFRTIATHELFDESALIPILDSLTAKYYNSVVLRQLNLKGDSLNHLNKLQELLIEYGNVLRVTPDKLTYSASTSQLTNALFVVDEKAVSSEIRTVATDIAPVFKNKHISQNVIGFIPANKKKAPYLFFTAHYDHLGGIGNQVYFPGASDNASGVAMLLTMASHYKKHVSKYNLVFIAFAGEEAGLIGSHYYVEHPVIPLKKIKFLVNLDLMGNGEDGVTIVNGSVFKEQFELLQAINTEKEYLPVIKSRGKAANSDHYFFTEAGVPSFFIYTMGSNTNYHDIYDVYEDLSFAKFDEVVNLLIDFVNQLE